MQKEIEFTPLYYDNVLQSKHQVVIQIGGRFSGKTQNDQTRLGGNLASKKNYKLLVIEDLETGMADGFHAGLRSRIEEFEHTGAYNPASRTAYIKNEINGNQALFKGYTTEQQRLNVKKLTGITEIVVEEGEWMDYDSFIGLMQQLRGGAKEDRKLTILMNPTNPECFVNKMFIMPQPDRVIEYFEGTARPKVFEKVIRTTFMMGTEEINQEITVLVVLSTHFDNPFLTLEQRATIEQLKETDPDKYLQLGEARFIGLAGSFFDKRKVQNRLRNAYPPEYVGEFEFDYVNQMIVDSSIKWIDNEDGCIRLYEKPNKGHPYVLSGDTAGEGSDWNIGYLTDNSTGYDIAVLRLNTDEDLYARQMYCLGRYYGQLSGCHNDALMGIETNFSTHPQKELERLGYSKMYVRESAPDGYTKKLAKKFGFNTNKATRPQMLGMLRSFVREHSYKLLDIDLLKEMTTFVKNEKGRPEAAKGFHDDMVMARAINLAIAWQQEQYVKVKHVRQELPRALRSTQDITEDNKVSLVDF